MAADHDVRLNDTYGSPEEYAKAIEELRGALSEGKVSTELEVLEKHGQSPGGLKSGYPHSVVVFPSSTEDVVKVVDISRKYRVPITPYGGATSLEGNVLASSAGGICVNVAGMDKILEIHEEDSDLVCQPGAQWMHINDTLKEKGIPLFCPLDPAMGATIGGMISTGCSGTNAVRYGTAKGEWFLNATIVLPSGEVIKTRRRSRKCSAGFDTLKLFIGAEGTLGIVTEVTLRLAPLLPTRVAVAQFPSVEAAVKASTQILNYGINLQCVELMDASMMRNLNLFNPDKRHWPEKDSLFFKIQGATDVFITESARIIEMVAARFGGTGFEFAATEEEAKELWLARKNAMPAALASIKGMKAHVTDVCVPVSRLPEIVAATQKDAAERGLYAPAGGHVGDGNLHTMIAYNEEDVDKANEVLDRLVQHALALDGTCTGEHGVGIGKKKYLVQELGASTVQFMKLIKQSVDPLNLFNPGKLYPDE